MYKDLADAVESLKENGYDHTFEMKDHCITCHELQAEYDPTDLSIVESHSFDAGTDPGSESTVHAIKSKDGIKGTLVLSYGMHVDPDKAELIDKLLSSGN